MCYEKIELLTLCEQLGSALFCFCGRIHVALFSFLVSTFCLICIRSVASAYVFVLIISGCPFGILPNVHVVIYQKLETIISTKRQCMYHYQKKKKKTMVYTYKCRGISIISTLLSLLIFFNLSSLGYIKCY